MYRNSSFARGIFVILAGRRVESLEMTAKEPGRLAPSTVVPTDVSDPASYVPCS